jgi:predicted phage tail protein
VELGLSSIPGRFDGTLHLVSDEMSNEPSSTARTASGEREVYRSAGALALGLSLIVGGAAALLLAGALAGTFASGVILLGFLAVAAIIAGIVQFIIGVYQCADNIDRAAKVLVQGKRG